MTNVTNDTATDRDDMRASAEHLRDVLDAIDSGELEASGRERAFIAGSLRTLELVNGPR